MWGKLLALCISLWATVSVNPCFAGSIAPDATSTGPFAIESNEYHLPASKDSDVLADTFTEVWAQATYPKDRSNAPYPVVIFLHGNHSTCGSGSNPRVDGDCSYTSNGTCPAGQVVVPNHMGYQYLAEKLASQGYVVVSINANRGITCGDGGDDDQGLNIARGRLVLKHLEHLAEWNRAATSNVGVDFRGMLDLTHVGLMGHSRGGEGVRAAYNLYRDANSPWPKKISAPLHFDGIFEIGPVDGQTSRTFNANNTAWNVLLPMCDGDVSDLEGIRPFDRMLSQMTEVQALPKSVYLVYGANHNFYNTEWQESDSGGCNGATPLWNANDIGSEKQRATAEASALAFFRSHVGANTQPEFEANFDTLFSLPTIVSNITGVDRSYAEGASPSTFWRDVDVMQSSQATAQNVSVKYRSAISNEDDDTLRGTKLTWDKSGVDTFYEYNWSVISATVSQAAGRPSGQILDVTSMPTLNFRIARTSNKLNAPLAPSNFSLQLKDSDDHFSKPLLLSEFVSLIGPSVDGSWSSHFLPITVRIPLKRWEGVDLTKTTGLRFTFDQTPQGEVAITELRFARSQRLTPQIQAGPVLLTSLHENPLVGSQANHSRRFASVRRIEKVHRLVHVNGKTAHQSAYEIEVESRDRFPVRDQLAVLRIGDREFKLSRYPKTGETTRLIFTIPELEFSNLKEGAPIIVTYNRDPSALQWSVGPFRH